MTKPDRVVLIGVAGDSGCGKSTFLRRLADLFGEEMMTVICLDDYHSLDRKGRKDAGVTALNPKANNFDLMAEQVKALKNGETIMKPIYNHETGLLDPPEKIVPKTDRGDRRAAPHVRRAGALSARFQRLPRY